MNIDFWNEYYFSFLYNTITDDISKFVRGVYITNKETILINLGASQWKGLSEENLISELTKTITHETIHYILEKEKIKVSDIDEEKICNILSGQVKNDS